MDQQPYQPGRSSSMDSPTFSSPLSKSLSDAGIQNLSSVLNNPLASSDASWTGWWSSSTSIPPPEFAPLLPNAKAASEVSRSDFQNYLSSIAESYNRFEDIRNHASKEEKYSDLDSVAGQAGEALVACLREVPSLYFKEDFALEDGPTFRAACPFTNVSENLVLQEKLSQYLDIVELHLVKEISLRSNSFFEAQGQLQDLNVKIVEGCNRIRELKETIRLLDENVVGSAQEIHDLNATRTNMLALQHKLRLILYVNQALAALKLLVASADCAGALDVTDDLQHLLNGDELAGLHCFRHLRDHVATSIDSINSILSAEFMRASIHDVGNTDMVIVSKAKARASILTNGSNDDVMLDEEEASNFRDRLLPIIVGLLRTGYHVAANDDTITFGTAILTVLRVHATNTGLIVAKLPSVLRIYRETLTADMKTAIKTAVAELIPILMARSLDSEFIPGERSSDADGEGLSLASKLRSLSSESFVQLLGAIFKIVRLYDAAKQLMTNGLAEAIDNLFNRKAHLVRASEVRKAVEWIMSNLEGHYAADSVAAAIAVGAAAAETVQESDAQGGSFLSLPPQNVTGIVPSSQRRASDAAGASNMSKNFRDDVIRENAEAVFAACDAAHGRWAKLLGVRAVLHPKLRLAEFLSIHNITQEFITATEKIGGRLGYSTRGALQSQAKAFVEFQHDIRMAKIRAVLDQETWAEIDVPNEFQAIVSSLFQSEALRAGDLDNGEGNITSSSDGVTSNDGSLAADAAVENGQKHVMRLDSSGMPLINSVQMNSAQSADTTEGIRADVADSSVQRNNNTMTERGRSASQSLLCGGVGYRMVNCGLILLKLLSEYLDMNNFLPALSVEIVQRVVEILKVFNTRTGHLVLGAGAMQVSGLRSITSKHLALASQVLSFVYAIIPEIRRILFNKVPETRKVLLLPEIDRVAQDYRAHRDEIYTKLVQIMRERLNFHLRSLPQIVENWNRPEDADPQPSQFARSLTKEVGYLQRVLSRTLHEADVQAIFRQVVIIFHSEITQQFSQLEISTPQARDRLHRDTTHILGCIRSLPSDDTGVSNRRNWGQLDEFLVQRYGSEAG